MTDTIKPQKQASRPELIMRGHDPENLEYPFSTLDSFITPNDQFYVRSHFPTPHLDAATWRLKVEGAVERELNLSLDDILSMPSWTVVSTMECAGNSRIFLTPPVKGVAWAQGAVGNAEWQGVSLADVLAGAGPRADAVEVILEGADAGEIDEAPHPVGKIKYSRSLPMEKARSPEVILAYRMNGEVLTASHGYPLRAVVPGWYGMSSVKWLTRLVVSDVPFEGYFQSIDYAYWERVRELPTRVPLGPMQIKSAIARPRINEVVPAGSTCRIFGAAWAGADGVERVQVSTDGGGSWAEARLLGEKVGFAWRFWEHDWSVPAAAGRATLKSRAVDGAGRSQPPEHDLDRGSYMINFMVPIEVEIA